MYHRARSWLLVVIGICFSSSALAGPYAGGSVDIKLNFSMTIGPTLAAGFSLAEEEPRGFVAAGMAGSMVGGRWPKLSLSAVLDGGVSFPDTHGFVHLNLSGGAWIFTAGPSFVVAFNGDHAGFALGPEATAHLNLGKKRGGHEIQLSARGDFFAAGGDHFAHAVVILLRFVLNVLS